MLKTLVSPLDGQLVLFFKLTIYRTGLVHRQWYRVVHHRQRVRMLQRRVPSHFIHCRPVLISVRTSQKQQDPRLLRSMGRIVLREVPVQPWQLCELVFARRLYSFSY